jgi:4-hydroxybenzoate polyprenyltransferase
MRPKQWTKNALIFGPLVFDGGLTNIQALLRVFVGFGLLCLSASTIYLINDIVDVEKDKLHPKKKKRPIPSGQLPIPIATVAALILPIISIGGALLYSVPLAAVLTVYLILHIFYSFYLKNVVLIDVFAIAAGFILRVVAGAAVITVANFSPWLYVCAGGLSLFLAVGKRRQEFIALGENAQSVRPVFEEYNLPLLDDMLRMVTTGTVLSYTFYTFEAKTSLAPNIMLLTVPFVIYGIFRYLYLIHVKGEGGAPDELLFKDRVLLLAITLWGAAVIFILYVLPKLPQLS